MLNKNNAFYFFKLQRGEIDVNKFLLWMLKINFKSTFSFDQIKSWQV